ncbi:hypothetical protein PEP31012_00837 [Pandoraea eparura]|uniref:DUF4145 domain-containing protein n=1 Tax=Pandoraea eparura TaxID=2508291 RepID=A0A5E4SJL2_9BURK|nr:DUF4145 domain-containing protein [Pandoraea eparura]VVD75910.1 hypothetical protein PEP31012_00837 [Pandoraea eparura]
MSVYVSDCPRCGAKRITHDVKAFTQIGVAHGWQHVYEIFCVCRHCRQGTIFVGADDSPEQGNTLSGIGLMHANISLNDFLRQEGYISKKDERRVAAPVHVPQEIAIAFDEGATCFAVNCFNAAGAMFRLCVDLATVDLLPADGTPERPNPRVCRDLGLRLPWLFDTNKLPNDLRDLATCIREDGNDGAHRGTLTKDEAADLQDFCEIFLTRVFTDPGRVLAAAERREARRAQ